MAVFSNGPLVLVKINHESRLRYCTTTAQHEAGVRREGVVLHDRPELREPEGATDPALRQRLGQHTAVKQDLVLLPVRLGSPTRRIVCIMGLRASES